MTKHHFFYNPFVIFLSAIFLLTLAPLGFAKSIVREGAPFLTVNKVYHPDKIKQGQFYRISAELTTSKNIWEDMSAFLHLVKADGTIVINNDFTPPIPTTHWVAGSITRLGPVNCFIPPDLPPGTYNIRLGLFASKTTPEGTIYIREPYTNGEIKDFIVGSLKVEEAPEVIAQEKQDFIISAFETLPDLKKWEIASAIAEMDTASPAQGKADAKITYLKGKGCCPSFALESFLRYADPKYSHWEDYDTLQFYLYGDPDDEENTHVNFPVTLQVKDKNQRRFQWTLPSSADKTAPQTILLSQIAQAIDLDRIGNFSFFVGGTPSDRDLTFHLDDVRLVSLNREKSKGPFVKFEGLTLSKQRVKPGEMILVEASFSITHLFSEDHTLFLHIYRTPDYAGWINADTTPSPPTTMWEVNTPITQGPFPIFIPSSAPPGRYEVAMGLMLSRQTPPGAQYAKYYRGKNGVYYVKQPNHPVDYFKQPYTNYQDYGDWVVGHFEVVE